MEKLKTILTELKLHFISGRKSFQCLHRNSNASPFKNFIHAGSPSASSELGSILNVNYMPSSIFFWCWFCCCFTYSRSLYSVHPSCLRLSAKQTSSLLGKYLCPTIWENHVYSFEQKVIFLYLQLYFFMVLLNILNTHLRFLLCTTVSF